MSMQKIMEQLDVLRPGQSLSLYGESGQPGPLLVECVSNGAFTCTCKNQQGTWYLVADEISETEIFYTYIKEKPSTNEVLSRRNIQSAVLRFTRYKGNIHQCIQWID